MMGGTKGERAQVGGSDFFRFLPSDPLGMMLPSTESPVPVIWPSRPQPAGDASNFSWPDTAASPERARAEAEARRIGAVGARALGFDSEEALAAHLAAFDGSS